MFSRMIRMIARLVIVSLLTLNMAWAYDDCAFSDPPSSGAGATQPLDPAPAKIPGIVPTCNHWCSGWMHLVTLPGSSALPPGLLPADFNGRLYVVQYVFLPAPPPTHPPSV